MSHLISNKRQVTGAIHPLKYTRKRKMYLSACTMFSWTDDLQIERFGLTYILLPPSKIFLSVLISLRGNSQAEIKNINMDLFAHFWHFWCLGLFIFWMMYRDFIHFKKRKRLRILTSSPITEDTVAPFMWMSSAKTETYLGHSSETQQ